MGEPLGLGDELAGDEAQGYLRDGTVEGGAEGDAAVVDYGDQGRRVAGAKFDLLNVRCVDPEMVAAQGFGGAAGDHGAGDGQFGARGS